MLIRHQKSITFALRTSSNSRALDMAKIFPLFLARVNWVFMVHVSEVVRCSRRVDSVFELSPYSTVPCFTFINFARYRMATRWTRVYNFRLAKWIEKYINGVSKSAVLASPFNQAACHVVDRNNYYYYRQMKNVSISDYECWVACHKILSPIWYRSHFSISFNWIRNSNTLGHRMYIFICATSHVLTGFSLSNK